MGGTAEDCVRFPALEELGEYEFRYLISPATFVLLDFATTSVQVVSPSPSGRRRRCGLGFELALLLPLLALARRRRVA